MQRKLRDTFLQTIQINEVYPDEKEIITLVKNIMTSCGAEWKQDDFGNGICMMAGSGDPFLLNTHLDIPESAPQIEYTQEGEILRSNGKTILGADPKAGLAVLLELARYIKNEHIATVPLEFVFTRGEEAGLLGARALDYSLLKARKGIVIDEDGPATQVVTGSVGCYNIRVELKGKTVHSRDWREGVNALAHGCSMLTRFTQGEIEKGITFNIGMLRSGEAVNSVPDTFVFTAELRSFDMERMEKVVNDLEVQIRRYAKEQGLGVEFEKILLYKAYEVPRDTDLFSLLDSVYQHKGWIPNYFHTFGGSDSNMFNANGVRTVAMGSGYYNAHQYTEYINLREMEDLLFFLLDVVRV